jgi:hypothetical protein
VGTSNTTASAITLQAGNGNAAGVSSGGDVVLGSSGAINVSGDGRAMVYTGSISGSTGMTIAAGRSRFNSAAGTSNFSTALGEGTHVIYREARVLTGTANPVTKTYDGNAYNTTALGWSGFVNNDSEAQLSSLSFTGNAEGAVNVGSYTISASATNGLGYGLSLVNGTLNVEQADLVLSGSREYDGTTRFAGTHLTATGVAGQTFTVAGLGDTSNLASKNTQTNQALNSVSGLSLGTSSNGGVSSNYNTISSIDSSISVVRRDITLQSLQASDKVFDGTTTAAITSASFNDLLGNETLSLSGSGDFSDPAVGNNKTVTVADVANLSLIDGTGLWQNYNLTSTGTFTTLASISAAPTPTPVPVPVSPPTTPEPSPWVESTIPTVRLNLPPTPPLEITVILDGLGNPFVLSTDEASVCTEGVTPSCECDSTYPEPDLDICYQRMVSAP